VSLHRIECDAVTGATVIIQQVAYKKDEEIIVLDVGIEPPEGFTHIELENNNG
jgi:hypothetical protein